jgi:phospholipase/carboxylesterase
MRDPSEFWRGVNRAAPALDAFLDAELARLGLGADRLALVGFSQGTMMALHVGFRRPSPIAGVVGYSGLIAGPEHLKAEAKSLPPVLLVHGEEDPLIPVAAIRQAAYALGAVGAEVEWHVRPGLAHGIDMAGLELGGAFLDRVFNKTTAG